MRGRNAYRFAIINGEDNWTHIRNEGTREPCFPPKCFLIKSDCLDNTSQRHSVAQLLFHCGERWEEKNCGVERRRKSENRKVCFEDLSWIGTKSSKACRKEYIRKRGEEKEIFPFAYLTPFVFEYSSLLIGVPNLIFELPSLSAIFKEMSWEPPMNFRS
jgi:hypothetical protein